MEATWSSGLGCSSFFSGGLYRRRDNNTTTDDDKDDDNSNIRITAAESRGKENEVSHLRHKIFTIPLVQ